jgi:transcriptional antiterminator NusG
MSEVNRMLGKVDELAVNTDTRSIPLILEKQLRLLMALLMVSMVLLKKINEEKRKLEVMVKIFGKKPLELVLCRLKKYNFCYI